ncbi:cytochrome P450 [Actinophytocola sp.]|uniref:cytochrome P450 n=1 Tax=Actinophytocola sp. TaxID=1872138 RepID=UPI003D6AED88
MRIVTSFEETQEILKSRAFGVEGSYNDTNAPLLRGSLIGLDGAAHRQRRRLLSRLFTRDRLAAYATDVVGPATDQQLSTQDGPRADLVPMHATIFWDLAAQLIGLDLTEAALERTGPLDVLVRTILRGIHVNYASAPTRTNAERAAVLDEAMTAMKGYEIELLAPATERRREMVRALRAGEVASEDLPRDVITVLLRNWAPEWTEDLLARETVLFMIAGTENSGSAVESCVYHLAGWLFEHPEDWPLTGNDEFLQRALYETIRLHTSGRKIHPRVAVRDVTLASSGTRFGPGDRVGLHLAAANRDPRVYGPDADRFDPRRADRLDRTVKPYGTGFAAGTHMCLGKDLVTGDLGASGRPGILLEVLRRWYRAGLELNPDAPPVRSPEHEDRFASFPVIFTRLPARREDSR